MTFKYSRVNILIANSVELATVVEGSNLLQDIFFPQNFQNSISLDKKIWAYFEMNMSKPGLNIQHSTSLDI